MRYSSEQLGKVDQYRVALVQPRTRTLLVEVDSGALRLPLIDIPQRTRKAEQISKAIYERWGLRTVVIDMLESEAETDRSAAVEVLASNEEMLSGQLVPVSAEAFEYLDLSGREIDALCALLKGDATRNDPFSRLGWIEDAQEWIRISLPNRRIKFDGDVRTLNVGAHFALVRLGTSQPPALWLKATGIPNVHEYMVSVKLAELFPSCLPPLVAARPDWNAWITEEIGQPLEQIMSLCAVEQASDCLARLQIGSVDQLDTLVSHGCFDQRLPTLRLSLPTMIHYLEDLMRRQTSTRVSPLEPARLRELGCRLEDACNSMEALGVPDALIHNDMNSGNILFDGSRAVFTDWAEAYIGNPFFTFHHLLVQAQGSDVSHTWAAKARAIYAHHWRSRLEDTQISRALAICPPLAMMSYLVGRDTTFRSPQRNDVQCQGYARSLARQMDRAVHTFDFLEALCH